MSENRTAWERLRTVDVSDYMLDTKELVTAKVMQTYLGGMRVNEAKRLIHEVVEDTVLFIPGRADNDTVDEPQEPSGDQMILAEKLALLHSELKADKLATLIDNAVADMKGRLEGQIRTAQTNEAAAVREITLQVIEQVNGKQTVANITLGFLCFLADCYKTLR